MTNYIPGVDISVIQGQLTPANWQALAASGIQWVGIRCSVGNNGVDSLYHYNVASAKAVSLKVLAYHFIFPLPPTAAQPLRDPVKQAQYHFANASGELASCDLEWPVNTDWARWGCSAQQIKSWTLTYLATYSSLAGKPMIVYTYPDYCRQLQLGPEFAQYPLWIASYEQNPTIPSPWTTFSLWQTTGGGGKLPNGAPCDQDVATDFSLWGVYPQQPTTMGSPMGAPIQSSMGGPISNVNMPVAAPQTPSDASSGGLELSEPTQTIQSPAQVPAVGTIGTTIVEGIDNIIKKL